MEITVNELYALSLVIIARGRQTDGEKRLMSPLTGRGHNY